MDLLRLIHPTSAIKIVSYNQGWKCTGFYLYASSLFLFQNVVFRWHGQTLFVRDLSMLIAGSGLRPESKCICSICKIEPAVYFEKVVADFRLKMITDSLLIAVEIRVVL